MHIFTTLIVIWVTYEACLGNLVNIGSKTYDVTYTLYHRYIGHRLEVKCNVRGPNVTWYRLVSNNTYEHVPDRDCSLEEHDSCNLVIKHLTLSDAGSYVCVDGINAVGANVHVTECKRFSITALPYYNQTVSEGDNATFVCEAYTGLTKCQAYIIDYLMKNKTITRNGVKDWQSPRVIYEETYRTSEDHEVQGVKVTLKEVNKEDFGMEVSIKLYDIESERQATCTAYLLEKGGTVVEEAREIIIIAVLVPVILVLLVICIVYFHPVIFYHVWWKHSSHGLPDVGDKEFHGLLLYNGTEDSYAKVQLLRKALSQYRLKEFPPGPDSGEQSAGYERFRLLDQMCQVSACVIIVGEVGEVEERCLPSFPGRHVTHIILGKSLTQEKKINAVKWPEKLVCLRWPVFVHTIRKNLPPVNGGVGRGDEEQMLTQI